MSVPARHPLDVVGGLRDRWELRRDARIPQPEGVRAIPLAEALAEMGARLPGAPSEALEEPALARLEEQLTDRLASAANPYPTNWNASLALVRTGYAVTRVVRPDAVVEVGVAAGLSSSFLTAALEANGAGHLHSIDPVLGTPDQVREIGWLVPAPLRTRHSLHRGRSRRLLPSILEAHRPAVVLLDGLHTMPTMRWEMERAGAALPPGGVLLADDVERNPAFAVWASRARPAWWSLVKTEHEGHVFGAAVL